VPLARLPRAYFSAHPPRTPVIVKSWSISSSLKRRCASNFCLFSLCSRHFYPLVALLPFFLLRPAAALPYAQCLCIAILLLLHFYLPPSPPGSVCPQLERSVERPRRQ
jgi:hypothetical protein